MSADDRVTWRGKVSDSAWFIACGAVLAVLAAIIEKWHGPSWFLLASGVIVAAGGVVVPALMKRADRGDERRKFMSGIARQLTDAGSLPMVADLTSKDYGAHDARLEVKYLSRRRESDVREALASGSPVLLVGDSMSGKSRLGSEVLRTHYADWRVWIPARPAGVASFFSGDAEIRRAIVWLDDLDGYLIAGREFRPEWLDKLVRSGNRVIGTIRSSEYARLLPSQEVRGEHWELLERFKKIWLADDRDERAALAARVEDPSLRRGILRYGLAEYIGGGDLALERFRAGESIHRLGAAMLRAAVDWQRIGLDAIPEPTLLRLAPAYLPDRFRFDQGEDPPSALDWATEKVGIVRLLEPAQSGWNVFDYLNDHIIGEGRQIPDAAWSEATAVVVPAQAAQVAGKAYELGRKDVAEAMLVPAAADDAFAAVLLGVLYRERRDIAGAKALFQQAIDLDDDFSGSASYFLGEVLEDEGDRAGARVAFERAVASGVSWVIPRATLSMGIISQLVGDAEAARKAFLAVAESSDRETALNGRNRLGVLLMDEGDFTGAEQCFRVVIESADPDQAPMAEHNLAVVLLKKGDKEGALAGFRAVIATGDDRYAANAYNNLGVLLLEQRDFAGAKAAFRGAIESRDPKEWPLGEHNLAVAALEEGNLAEEEAALQMVIATGHAKYAPEALSRIGKIRIDGGDIDGAIDAFRRAAMSDDPDDAAGNELNLAKALYRKGDMIAAKAAFQRVIATGHPDHVPSGQLNLGMVLLAERDIDAAREAFRAAADSGDPEVMHMATNNIGKILMDEDGDLAGARAAFLKALASDDKEAAALAQNNLGVLLLKEGDAAGARVAFRLALETGDSTAMEYATNNLAALPEEA